MTKLKVSARYRTSLFWKVFPLFFPILLFVLGVVVGVPIDELLNTYGVR